MAPSSDGTGESQPNDSGGDRRKRKNKQKKDKPEAKEPPPPNAVDGLKSVYYRTLRGGERDHTVSSVSRQILEHFGSENPKYAKYITSALGGTYTLDSIPTAPDQDNYGKKDAKSGDYSDPSKIAYQSALEKHKEKMDVIETFQAALMLLINRQCSERVIEML